MHSDGEFSALARMLALASNDNDANCSYLALRVIRELTAHRSDWEQPIIHVEAGPTQELFLQVVEWLAEESILKLRDGNVRLTAEGRRSLAAAADSDQLLSEFLSDYKNSLDRYEANRAMLSILRRQFELRSQKSASGPSAPSQ